MNDSVGGTTRRALGAAGLAALLGSGATGGATAQPAPTAGAGSYPNRPIRLVVPLSPGGPGDILTRALVERVSPELGQPIVVENRPGANSNIGFEHGARAEPDGYTLLLGLAPLTINPSLFARVGYDPVRDFAPITLIGTFPLVLAVHPSVPAATVGEFIAHARANPGALTYGSNGIGSTPHLAGAMLDVMAGVRTVHVPYRGIAEAMVDLVAGRIQFAFPGPPVALPHAEAGRIRLLAVTSAARSTTAPGLPTMAEAGGLPGFEVSAWYAVLAPAGTPAPVVARLHDAFAGVLRRPETAARWRTLGADVAWSESPAQFAAFIAADVAKWRQVLQQTGVRVD